MLFSIIVPIYNVKPYLRQCVESVLKQSYSEFELLLINDGSTDESGSICDEYANKDKRVQVIHKTNGGVSDARNAGLLAAKGEYIMFIDGDDYWENDILDEIEKTINKSGDPDFIFVNKEYREYYNGVKEERSNGLIAEEFNILKGEDALEYILTKTSENLFSVWRGVYKNEIIQNNKLFFETEVTVGEDADWLFRYVLCTAKCTLFQNPFYVYRINRIGSAMSQKSEKAISTFLHVVIKWIKIYKETPNAINRIIATKLSENYIDNFKYIYYFDRCFRDKIIAEINGSNLLDYVVSRKSMKVKKGINCFGIRITLFYLNKKWKTKQMVKHVFMKLRVIS